MPWLPYNNRATASAVARACAAVRGLAVTSLPQGEDPMHPCIQMLWQFQGGLSVVGKLTTYASKN